MSGTTVTATIEPENVGSATIEAAEFYVDTDPILSDGYRIPMTLSGTSGTVTASGTLPTLPIGSSHTMYVHGQGLVPVDNYTWGAFASTEFTVTATTVALPLGNAEVSLSNNDYSINLAPTDPCHPTDPCRSRSFLVGFVATNGLKYHARTTGLLTTYMPR